MRQSDIFTVIIVASVGTLAAFFLCNWILGNPDDQFETFKTISVVSPDVALPDSDVFNVGAINPTVEVYVGNCEDVDQNGRLDRAELIACGRIDGERSAEEEAEEEPEEVVVETPVEPVDEETPTEEAPEEFIEEGV